MSALFKQCRVCGRTECKREPRVVPRVVVAGAPYPPGFCGCHDRRDDGSCVVHDRWLPDEVEQHLRQLAVIYQGHAGDPEVLLRAMRDAADFGRVYAEHQARR